MAKFGEEFVRQASNPSFLGGLFTAGQAAGSYGRRKQKQAEKKALAKGLLGLEAMNQSGELTAEMYQDAVKSYAELGTDAESRALIKDTMRRVGQNFTPEAEMQRELAGIRLDQARTQQRNDNLLLVAGNMTKEQRQRFLDDERVPEADKNVFRNFERTLQQHEMNDAEYRGWKESMETAVPTTGIQESIDLIQDPELRRAKQKEFDRLVESAPKTYSNQPQKDRVARNFTAFSQSLAIAIGQEQSRIDTEERAYNSAMATARRSATTGSIRKDIIDAEVSRLEDLDNDELAREIKTYLPNEKRNYDIDVLKFGKDQAQLERLATKIIVAAREADAVAAVNDSFGRTGAEEPEEPEEQETVKAFEVGKVYVDTDGNRAIYKGNEEWEIIE